MKMRLTQNSDVVGGSIMMETRFVGIPNRMLFPAADIPLYETHHWMKMKVLVRTICIWEIVQQKKYIK